MIYEFMLKRCKHWVQLYLNKSLLSMKIFRSPFMMCHHNIFVLVWNKNFTTVWYVMFLFYLSFRLFLVLLFCMDINIISVLLMLQKIGLIIKSSTTYKYLTLHLLQSLQNIVSCILTIWHSRFSCPKKWANITLSFEVLIHCC